MTLLERLAIALEKLRRLEDEKVWLPVRGTSHAQMQFVMWVGKHPGCRLQQVAAGLGLSAPTVSVGVQRLEQAGLLQRASDEHDQRAINLVLSTRGQKLYTQASNNHERSLKALLDKLKPADQSQVVDLLERCLGITQPAPEVLPVEPPTIVAQKTPVSESASDAVSPENPKQLDLFG